MMQLYADYGLCVRYSRESRKVMATETSNNSSAVQTSPETDYGWMVLPLAATVLRTERRGPSLVD